MTELPTMAKLARVSTSYDPGALGTQGLMMGKAEAFHGGNVTDWWGQDARTAIDPTSLQAAAAQFRKELDQPKQKQAIQPLKKEITMRIVRVYIADTNTSIPLDKRLVYTGDEKLTDLDDQELFFELNIAEILKKHNEYRTTVADKVMSAKMNKEVMLEPARVRDLKMVVVDVASF